MPWISEEPISFELRRQLIDRAKAEQTERRRERLALLLRGLRGLVRLSRRRAHQVQQNGREVMSGGGGARCSPSRPPRNPYKNVGGAKSLAWRPFPIPPT